MVYGHNADEVTLACLEHGMTMLDFDWLLMIVAEPLEVQAQSMPGLSLQAQLEMQDE